MTKLQQNIILGIAAAAYARNKINASSNAPKVAHVPFQFIEANRHSLLSPEASLKGLFRVEDLQNDINVLLIKHSNEQIKKLHAGNCTEYTYQALNYLRKKGVVRADYYVLATGDHAFVVIDRKANSDPTNPLTWGKNAVVCDPWSAKVYKATDIPLYLSAYKFLGNDLHLIEPFNAKVHGLTSITTIGGNDTPTKRNGISDAIKKLEIIRNESSLLIKSRTSSLSNFLLNISFEIDSLLKLQASKSQINQYSNLELERQLSKTVLHYLKTALELAGNKDSALFTQVLIDDWIALQKDYTKRIKPNHVSSYILWKYFNILRNYDYTVTLPLIEGISPALLDRIASELSDGIDGSILHGLLMRRNENSLLMLLPRLTSMAVEDADIHGLYYSNNWRQSLLHLAAQKKWPDCFKLLLDKYSDSRLNIVIDIPIEGKKLPEIVLKSLGLESFFYLLDRLPFSSFSRAIKLIKIERIKSPDLLNAYLSQVKKWNDKKQRMIMNPNTFHDLLIYMVTNNINWGIEPLIQLGMNLHILGDELDFLVLRPLASTPPKQFKNSLNVSSFF